MSTLTSCTSMPGPMGPARDLPGVRGTPRLRFGGLRARIVTAPLLALLVVVGAFLPAPAAADTTHSRNLWVDAAFLYQDPYNNACTAASTMIMLNTIAYRGTGGNGFAWTPYRVKKSPDPADKRDMTSILSFERAHDTLVADTSGSDPHGWRNALNFYGWGKAAMTDPSLMPYVDKAYRSFDGALKAAVKAIARQQMPVGILAWAGGHAQVMTGYIVTGDDPRISNDFTVTYVYVSDPLKRSEVVNRKLSYEAFKAGALRYRFRRYLESDSPYDDPYVDGTIASSVSSAVGPSEWYSRWVIVVPVRSGLPEPGSSPAGG